VGRLGGIEVVATVVGSRFKAQMPTRGNRCRVARDPGTRQGGIGLNRFEHPIEVLASRRAGVVQHDPPKGAPQGP